jgi:hypothetical protein
MLLKKRTEYEPSFLLFEMPKYLKVYVLPISEVLVIVPI